MDSRPRFLFCSFTVFAFFLSVVALTIVITVTEFRSKITSGGNLLWWISRNWFGWPGGRYEGGGKDEGVCIWGQCIRVRVHIYRRDGVEFQLDVPAKCKALVRAVKKSIGGAKFKWTTDKRAWWGFDKFHCMWLNGDRNMNKLVESFS